MVGDAIVRDAPTGGLPSYATSKVVVRIREYARSLRRGHPFSDNAVFVVDLPNRQSFSPDATYYLGPITKKFGEGAPVFAVEVRSERDYGPAAERAMARERNAHFAAGTLVV